MIVGLLALLRIFYLQLKPVVFEAHGGGCGSRFGAHLKQRGETGPFKGR